MRKTTCIFWAFLLAISCLGQKRTAVKVKITNPIDIPRISDMVELSVSDIKVHFDCDRSKSVFIVKNADNQIIPSQVTYEGNLIFQSGLTSQESTDVTITLSDEEQNYQPFVFGRFFPERKDDFAWENDRVGFRYYGKTLQDTEGPNTALDLFWKRTDKMILEKWYADDISRRASYHVDHGEGCDPYNVGRSLGGGNMVPFENDTIWLNENYISYEILDKGPLRITAKLIFPAVDVKGKRVPETKIISLDAGSQLTKIIQEFDTEEPMKVAAGIVKRGYSDSTITSFENNYLIYQEPADEKNGQIYLGVLIPQGIEDIKINNYSYTHPISKKLVDYTHVLAITTYQPDKKLTYYTGFGWNKYGFDSLKDFQAYMTRYNKALQSPFKIEIQ